MTKFKTLAVLVTILAATMVLKSNTEEVKKEETKITAQQQATPKETAQVPEKMYEPTKAPSKEKQEETKEPEKTPTKKQEKKVEQTKKPSKTKEQVKTVEQTKKPKKTTKETEEPQEWGGDEKYPGDEYFPNDGKAVPEPENLDDRIPGWSYIDEDGMEYEYDPTDEDEDSYLYTEKTQEELDKEFMESWGVYPEPKNLDDRIPGCIYENEEGYVYEYCPEDEEQ